MVFAVPWFPSPQAFQGNQNIKHQARVKEDTQVAWAVRNIRDSCLHAVSLVEIVKKCGKKWRKSLESGGGSGGGGRKPRLCGVIFEVFSFTVLAAVNWGFAVSRWRETAFDFYSCVCVMVIWSTILWKKRKESFVFWFWEIHTYSRELRFTTAI